MPSLPSGTVTFVFSDIEGSTALLKRLGDAGYADVLARHRRLVRETFAEHGGLEIDTQGDAFFYSFPRARAAVAAAVAIQRAHASEEWPDGAQVRIRLGLHTGEPAVGEEGYTGLDVVRASRIAAVGRGGQVLLSDTTRAIVSDDLPAGVELRWVGEQRLKDIERPEPLNELVIDGLPAGDATTAGDAMTARDALTAAPPAGPTGGELPDGALAIPGVAEAIEQIPPWFRDRAKRFIPTRIEANSPIERRVLGEIERAMRDRSAERAERRRDRAARHPPARSTSVADEIAKLRSLRDAGALTEEQYARAVDRAIGSD